MDIKKAITKIELGMVLMAVSKFFPYIFIFSLALFVDFDPAGPDSKLYYGLAKNLVNKIGYIDNIRGDEILPSIGYPIIIASSIKLGINAYLFAKLCIAASFVFLHKTFKLFLLNNIESIISMLIFYFCLPVFNIWGVELVLLVSNTLLMYVIVFSFFSRNSNGFLYLSGATLINVLIRPILMPFLYLSIPISGYLVVKNAKSRKKILLGAFLFWGILLYIGNFSVSQYGDKRMLSGTYSEIPLYCAWNRYIPLDTNYFSSAWSLLSEDVKKEALEPLQNTSGWQDRSSRLKKAAIKFAIDEPSAALKGYFWRLSKFTINADNFYYKVSVYLWLIMFFVTIANFKKLEPSFKQLLSLVSGIALYIIMVIAIFPFVGDRYYVTPAIFLWVSLACFIYILNSKRTNKYLLPFSQAT